MQESEIGTVHLLSSKQTEIVGDKNGGKGILLPFYLALGVMARKLQAITYSFKNKGAKNYLKPTPLHNYQRPL